MSSKVPAIFATFAVSLFGYAALCFMVAPLLPLDCWSSVGLGVLFIVLAFGWAFLFGDSDD